MKMSGGSVRVEVMDKKLKCWGRGTAVLGGLIWAGFFIWMIRSAPSRIGGSLAILILPLLGFMLASYALSRAPGGGRVGLLVMVGGMGLMLLGVIGVSLLRIGEAWLMGILGEMVISVGLGWFAIANLSDRRLPALNGLPLLMLLLYVPSWMVDPGNLPGFFPDYFTELLAAVYGLSWVVLGGVLLLPGMARDKDELHLVDGR
jgi:hypothetical protein